MSHIFNIYRGGFQTGLQDGSTGRRRADWELVLTHPITWLPGVDKQSFLDGYAAGYSAGICTLTLLPRLREFQ